MGKNALKISLTAFFGLGILSEGLYLIFNSIPHYENLHPYFSPTGICPVDYFPQMDGARDACYPYIFRDHYTSAIDGVFGLAAGGVVLLLLGYIFLYYFRTPKNWRIASVPYLLVGIILYFVSFLLQKRISRPHPTEIYDVIASTLVIGSALIGIMVLVVWLLSQRADLFQPLKHQSEQGDLSTSDARDDESK